MTKDNEVWPHGAPAVGQRAARSRKVSMVDIELFAAISGDRNPLPLCYTMSVSRPGR